MATPRGSAKGNGSSDKGGDKGLKELLARIGMLTPGPGGLNINLIPTIEFDPAIDNAAGAGAIAWNNAPHDAANHTYSGSVLPVPAVSASTPLGVGISWSLTATLCMNPAAGSAPTQLAQGVGNNPLTVTVDTAAGGWSVQFAIPAAFANQLLMLVISGQINDGAGNSLPLAAAHRILVRA